MNYYVDALKNYFNFTGRTSRKAFWMFALYTLIFSWAAIALDNILGTTHPDTMMFWKVPYGVFYNIYSGVLAIPSLAIIVRRLHDVGKKGTLFFIVFIPAFGAFWILLYALKEGDPAENEYGPVPDDAPKTAPGTSKDDRPFASDTPSAMATVQKKKEPKAKKPRRPLLQDRNAVDFTYHSKEKRKT